jgi:hypothetical protein
MLMMLRFREVVQMCQAGKAKQARTMLAGSLAHLNSKDQKIKKRLLDCLFYVEQHLGHLAAASRVLELRRALGYSKPELRMEAALHAATLLARQSKAEQARTELLSLICNPKLHEWHGVLKALTLYVEVERECRDSVDDVLRKASAAAIRKFDIRFKPGEKKSDVRELISTANTMYGSASQTYSQLLIRSLSGTSKQEHEAAIRDLRRFAKVEKVGFFRMQAKSTLRELVKRKAGRFPRSRF